MSIAIQSFKALTSDIVVIAIAYFLCTEVSFWNGIFSSSVIDFLPVFAGCLIVCSLTSLCYDLYFLKTRYNSSSYKAYKFIQFLFVGIYRNNYEKIEKKYTYSFFLILIKITFIPLMIQFTVNNFFGIKALAFSYFSTDVLADITWSELFNNSVYPLLLTLCFFIDTVFYLFGYLIYNEALGNTVRSVETTFFGWIAALLCYPPLFVITAEFLPISGNDSPFWLNNELTAVVRIVMFFLLLIYTLATVNLGWKCSNLTNRGIVSHGVYSVVRHPAYIAKNLFWWVSLLPVFFISPIAIVYMLGLSSIYFFRALTEERHLYKDQDYVKYCQKVKYRFTPKIF